MTVTSLSCFFFFFFSSRRRHTRFDCDWSSDVCSSDLSPTPRSFPSNFFLPGRGAGVLANVPIFHAAVLVIIIFLRKTACRSGLMLVVILFDLRHQRFCVAELENDLARSSALQVFAAKLL